MNSFKGSLPSSFLVATYGHCLLTPRNCLQKYMCLFDVIFLPVVEIIFFFICVPQSSEPYSKIGRKRESKSFLVALRDNFEKSK